MMNWPERFFISGTDTDVGKTVVSALLTAGLGADYWKPIQAGTFPQTDAQQVKMWAKGYAGTIHPETYVLKTPASPHLAAQLDRKEIRLDNFSIPKTDNRRMIIEGAGGLLVPLNNEALIIDLIKKLELPVVLVARSGLGTINHTLLSLEALKSRNISVFGVIMNGEPHEENKKAIEHYGKVPVLGRVPELNNISPEILHNLFKEIF